MASPTAASLAAYASGSIGIYLNSQGFLLLYVLGAVKILGDLGLVNPDQTFASKGTASLVSAAVCSKTPYIDILVAVQKYLERSHDPFLSVSSRRALMRQAADQMLPADAHTLCSYKAFISVSTELAPRSNAGMQATPTSSTAQKTVKHSGTSYHVASGAAGAAAGAAQVAPVYANRDALLDAIVDSSFPLAIAPQSIAAAGDDGAAAAAISTSSQVQSSLGNSGPAAAVALAHTLGAASGVMAFCPAGVKFCVKITALPPGSTGSSNSSSSKAEEAGSDIVYQTGSSSSSSSQGSGSSVAYSTGTKEADEAVSVQLSATFSHANTSTTTTTTTSSSSSIDYGKELKVNFSTTTSISSDTSTTSPQQAALAAITVAATAAAPSFSSSAADIYPGLSQPLALQRSEWLSYMVLTPSPKLASYLHYLGRVDAYIWANSTGLISAAVAEQNKQLTELLLTKIASINAVDALFQEFVEWPAKP